MKRISLLFIFALILCGIASGCGRRSTSSSDTPTIPLQEQPTFASEWKELELSIKQAFIKKYLDSDTKISPDDLTVRYYGEYCGFYAVFVDGGIEYEKIETVETFHGCEFKYPTTQKMLLFKNNLFFSLNTGAGILSKDDIKNLHGYYLGHNLYLYKTLCQATEEDSFAGNHVTLVINPLYNFKEYTTEDFSEVDCVEVRDLWSNIKGTVCCRILRLTLNGDSKQNVLEAIKKLELREDVYSAEPDYVIGIN